MKSIFRYIIFSVLAVSAVLAACSKDTVVESNPGTAEGNQGLRTIILQFSPDTKAAFNGVKSSFVDGDVIKISNATQSADVTVSVANGVASITTALTGNLTAVFPSTAANVSGTNPIGTPAYKVPSVQDGTPEKTVIAVANITGPSAVFELQTALFQITPPSTATKIIIKSLSPVVDGVARTGTAADINTDGTEKTTITVGDGSANLPNPIYVALVPGVNLTDLSFDAGEAVGMKGIPENKLGTTPNATVARGKYTIDNSNWHPYVTIGGLKWATMNIGATDIDPYGTYFSWGSVEKVYTSLAVTTFTFNSDNPDTHRYTGGWTPGSGFAVCNTPYYNSTSSSYSKYNTTDRKTVLDLADDAAYVNWGGPWRMPTGGKDANSDFIALFKAVNDGYLSDSIYYTGYYTSGTPSSRGVYYYDVSGETKGIYFVADTTHKLFFPVTGYGNSLSLNSPPDDYIIASYYWSSSLKIDNANDAYHLFFDDCEVDLFVDPRFDGYPVRPVADL